MQCAPFAPLKVLLPCRIIDRKFAQDGTFVFRGLVAEADDLCRLVIVKGRVFVQGNGDQDIRHLYALELIGGDHYAQ